MPPIKVLFIDDQEETIKPVTDSFKASRIYRCAIGGFIDYEKVIMRENPDIVVLDLAQGSSFDVIEQLPGIEVFNSIRRTRFCPIIIYTGFPHSFSQYEDGHPLVSVVAKGANSITKIKSILKNYKPLIVAAREAEGNVREAFRFVWREIAPKGLEVFPKPQDSKKRNSLIVRAARRRLAAIIDDFSLKGEKLVSWEPYIYPPVNKNLQLGDLLRLTYGNHDDPRSYHVVLTPSCDLDTTNDRKMKVGLILAARCCDYRKGVSLLGWTGIKKSNLKEKLLKNRVLTTGYLSQIVFLPGLPGVFQDMVLDLKDLILIHPQFIGNGERYERVVSIDSPFRELFSWAYMCVACRPGLPDREFGAWAENIEAAYGEDGN